MKSGGFTVEQCSILWDAVLESDSGQVHPDLLKPRLANAFLRASVSLSVTWDWQSLIRWCENVRACSLWSLPYDVQNLVKKHSESVVNYIDSYSIKLGVNEEHGQIRSYWDCVFEDKTVTLAVEIKPPSTLYWFSSSCWVSPMTAEPFLHLSSVPSAGCVRPAGARKLIVRAEGRVRSRQFCLRCLCPW